MRDKFDHKRLQAAVRELLIAIGEDPDREGLRDTPARVARAYREVFAGLFADPGDVLEATFDENHGKSSSLKRFRSTRRASITSCPGTALRRSALQRPWR